MSTAPRVVVTDAEERSVLAACRGLAAAGYRVTTVGETRFASAHWSRFSRERIALAGPWVDPNGYVERLRDVLRAGAYDALLPGTDASLLPISVRRELIEPHARLGLPAHGVVLRALDKPLLQRSAAAVGLAPPRSVACATDDEARAASSELRFPVVVKPARSVVWTDGHMRQHVVRFAGDARALEAAVAVIGVPLTIQEFVADATVVSFAAVRIDGELLGLTVARYARTYPARIGSAAHAVTVEPDPCLAERVGRLLRLIGWQGMFELELLDLGDGRFGAVDFNPRPFGWLALAVGAGANLPALWCDRLLGRSGVPAAPARLGVHYRWEEGDARGALAHVRQGRPGAALPVLRPHRRVVHAQFRIDDPGPLVARMLTLARKVVATSGRRSTAST